MRHVPAAVITGDYFTQASVDHELEALGIEMHLKPLWDDELVRVVADLLKRPRPLSYTEQLTADRPLASPTGRFAS
jgi:hypothetical protein